MSNICMERETVGIERDEKMLKLKKLRFTRPAIPLTSSLSFTNENNLLPFIPSRNPSQWLSNRFLDIFQIGNKAAIEKERARLSDEMNRGYFADMSEFKKHGGKIAMANKIIIPAMAAVKFPSLEVNYSDGTSLKLPITADKNDANAYKQDVPKVSLFCLTFRASSQAMTDSWSTPFIDAFRNSEKIGLYEVSFIDSWLLSLNPIKKLLLRMMRKSNPNDEKNTLQRNIVYSFGDNYYFRKELKILNLLTGYVFLVDGFGRIRWQGFGLSTPDEVTSLLSCTSLLLEEK